MTKLDNLRHWNALGKTDPKHTKPFARAGGFRGTATKPIWLTMRLTEHFGPCGVGWGMGKPEFQTVAAGDEILVFCTVSLWYIDEAAPETEATVYGVGGDKVLSKNKNGPVVSDEAFKASYTDALSNAMKQIGVAADIHMGLFEDHKYVREVAQEFTEPAAPAEQPRTTALSRLAVLRDQISACATLAEVDAWWGLNYAEIEKLPETSSKAIFAAAKDRKRDLRAADGDGVPVERMP